MAAKKSRSTSGSGNPASNPPMPSVASQPMPQGGTVAGSHVYASVLTRFVAALIDGIIIAIAVSVLSYPLSLLTGNEFMSLFQIINWLVGYPYYIYMTAKNGQTVGKQLMKIKVIKIETNSPPNYTSAFLREVVGKLISGFVLGLGYLWAIWDKQKQTWHDKIAGTVVVKV